MKHKAWMVLCLSLLAVPAAAGQATPQDFAFGADFSEGQSSLRQATLPADVLERIQQPDFADVRVFNADGESVPFEITSLADKAVLPEKQQWQWQTLGKPEVRQEQGASEWLFANPGVIPVGKIRLMPPGAGNVYTGDVYSRSVSPPGEKERWQYRGRLNQYLLNLNDTQVQSDAASVTVARDRFWKIRLDGPTAASQVVPEIAVGWRPDTLLFLAQGNAPFTLAFGSSAVGSAGFGDLSASIPDVQAQSVSLGEIRPLGDVDPNRQSFPWKLVVLWLVLISGTLLMAYMAFSLYRQMNRNSGAP